MAQYLEQILNNTFNTAELVKNNTKIPLDWLKYLLKFIIDNDKSPFEIFKYFTALVDLSNNIFKFNMNDDDLFKYLKEKYFNSYAININYGLVLSNKLYFNLSNVNIEYIISKTKYDWIDINDKKQLIINIPEYIDIIYKNCGSPIVLQELYKNIKSTQEFRELVKKLPQDYYGDFTDINKNLKSILYDINNEKK